MLTEIENAKTALGKKTAYKSTYDLSLLLPISRESARTHLGLGSVLPFHGNDYWTAYEISCLNQKGKPMVAIGQITVPCTSTALIESKSLKLYLNSFNMTVFSSLSSLKQVMRDDLSQAANAQVDVKLYPLSDFQPERRSHFEGICLDALDIDCHDYKINPSLLTCQKEKGIVHEKLYSDLLKSNCLVTGQPDWGSIFIEYHGTAIEHASLLRYIISFREHLEFNEHCIERIFCDIIQYCKPSELTVCARYTRRGGLDASPYRSTKSFNKNRQFIYLARQ